MASHAWRTFIDDLRETTQLLRADPASRHAKRAAHLSGAPVPVASVDLSSAINKASVMLISGRLQGCIASQLEEFLERIDQSGVLVDDLPEVLRTSLCLHLFGRPGTLNADKAAQVHKRYAQLWIPGTQLQPGTVKTDSLPDPVWNPRPKRVNELLGRCGIDLFGIIKQHEGRAYLDNLTQYVGELIDYRNSVAHGDDPNPWTAADLRLRLRWCVRLARWSEITLGVQLEQITGRRW